MPSAPHPAAPRALGLSDYYGAMRRALGGEIARNILGRLDFLEVVNLAADRSGLMIFDRSVRMLRHSPRESLSLARPVICPTAESSVCLWGRNSVERLAAIV